MANSVRRRNVPKPRASIHAPAGVGNGQPTRCTVVEPRCRCSGATQASPGSSARHDQRLSTDAGSIVESRVKQQDVCAG